MSLNVLINSNEKINENRKIFVGEENYRKHIKITIDGGWKNIKFYKTSVTRGEWLMTILIKFKSKFYYHKYCN